MLTVINRHHYKKGELPQNAIYIGRGTPFGNPYKVEDQRSIDGSSLSPEEARSQAIKLYKRDVWKILKSFGTDPDPSILVNSSIWSELNQLTQRVYNGQAVMLACSCHPSPCHGDVIVGAIENYLLPKYDELITPFIDSVKPTSQPEPKQSKLQHTLKPETAWTVGCRVRHVDDRVVDRRPVDDRPYSFLSTNRPARKGTVVATPDTDPWGVCQGMLLIQWDDNAEKVLMSQHPVKHLNQFNIICRPSTIPSSLLELLPDKTTKE